MNTTLLDDTQSNEDIVHTHEFTSHGTPVRPVSSEDQIRSDAASVIPRIPLPGESNPENSERVSYSSETSIHDLNDLTAEDIHENY
jgi:hypothetical protein